MLLQNPLSIDDLLNREVGLRWFEGVSIVQSLCRQMLEAGRADQGFPGPADVLLGADGAVSILRIPAGSEGVASAARMLATMQGDDVPVQLRLLVAQATGPESVYPTLADFSGALAFFERPDAQQVLRLLHERASQAPPIEGARPQPAETPGRPSEPAPAPATSARKRPKQAPVLIALPVATLACAAVWLFGFGTGDASTPRAGSGTEEQTAEIGSTTRRPEPLENGTARTGLAGRTSARSSPAGSSSGEALRHAGPVAATRRWITPLLGFGDADPLRPLPPDLVSYDSIEVTASPAPGAFGRPSGNAERIYSLVDRDVVPPRAIYPKLPESSGTAPAAGRTVLELVIAADGFVERVRMRTEPRNVHEFMLLSAAKAWRFEPATVNGWPVRFIHRVVLPAP